MSARVTLRIMKQRQKATASPAIPAGKPPPGLFQAARVCMAWRQLGRTLDIRLSAVAETLRRLNLASTPNFAFFRRLKSQYWSDLRIR